MMRLFHPIIWINNANNWIVRALIDVRTFIDWNFEFGSNYAVLYHANNNLIKRRNTYDKI